MNIKWFIETNGRFYSDIICKDENGNEGILIWADTRGINIEMEVKKEDGVIIYGDTSPLESVETFELLGEFENINGWDNGDFPDAYDRKVKLRISFYANDEYRHEKDVEHVYTGEGYVYFRSAEGEDNIKSLAEGIWW